MLPVVKNVVMVPSVYTSSATPALVTPAPKKKWNYRKRGSGKKMKSKVIPFSRPMMPIESDQELASLLAGIDLDGEAVYNRFEAMGLRPELLRGICEFGLEVPSFIQQRAIAPCVKGRDVIVQAQSGMGKTAALAISILQRIVLSNPQCQALVIAPTRELAEQICDVFAQLGRPMGVTTYACIGGTNTKECQKDLLAGKQIVVGTTGRTRHMIFKDQNDEVFLDTGSIKTLAFDEADKMLTGEFKRDVTDLFEMISMKTQIILMSATMPEHIMKLTDRFMRKPVKFLVNNDELTLEGIRQYYLNVGDEASKLSALSDIYDAISKAQGMIFCNSRLKVKELSRQMEDMGHVVSAMRGDLDQGDRDKVLRDFRMGASASRMLITSDLLARGIDVQQVTLVINYGFPEKKEEYIHRVGRGGRYGRKGAAITFVTDAELPQLKIIEEFYNTHIQEMPMVQSFIDLLVPRAQSLCV